MNSQLKHIIEDAITQPAFLTDENWRIVDSNKNGKFFLEDYNLLDVEKLKFDLTRNNELAHVLKNHSSSSNVETKMINLAGDKLSKTFSISITPVSFDEMSKYLLVFHSVEETHGKYKYIINSDEIEELTNNEEFNQILEKVKSSFPFTFIGKQKFQREIDKLESAFVIKNTGNNIIIANKAFASQVKLKLSQIINKNCTEFYPAVEKEIISNADNFIRKTTRPIIIESSKNSLLQNQLMLPLVDLSGTVVATLCLSIQKDSGEKPQHSSQPNDEYHLIRKLDFPVLILDKSGKFLNCSEFYIKNFTMRDPEEFDDSSKLPSVLLKEFEEFVQNDILQSFSSETVIKAIEEKEYYFHFRKISTNANKQLIYVEPKQNNASTQLSELKDKMYDIIMHTSPEPMFIYDIENLKFLEVNHAALKLYGYTRDEFLEMDLTDLYAPEDIQTLIESSPSKTTSSDFTGPWRHKHRDGRTILVEISKSMLEFESKKAHFNIVRDVTKFIDEKMQLQKYKAVYDNTSDMLVFTDRDGFIISFNRNFTTQLELSREFLDKKPLLSLITDADRARINSEIFHSGLKTRTSLETKLKSGSGKEIPVQIIANPIIDFNDDVESFNLTIKSKESNQTQVVVKEVQSSKPAVDPSFLSNLFHEILTPINVITGFVQELAESIKSPSEEQQEAIAFIKDNQHLLLQIMDTAVEYSTLEQNDYEIIPESIVFVEILEEIEENVHKVARDKGIEFTYGKISSSLKIDSDKQKFTTFVTLAVKFALSATSKKRIYLSAYQNSSDTFVVSLKDERNELTDELFQNLNNIFTLDENVVKQNFGISRFASRLARNLLKLLKARREIISEKDQSSEYAFVFPLKLTVDEVVAEDEPEVAEPTIVIDGREYREEPIAKKQAEKTIEVKETHPEIEIIDRSPVVHAEPKPVVERQSMPQTEIKEVQPEVKIVEEVKIKETPVVNDVKPQHKSFQELTCLYVEDQVDSQILFKVQMKDLKGIEFANSFERALPLIQNRHFDFIVMDINLQGEYNGLDALRAIQKMPDIAGIPIIAVTAYVLPGDREKFIAAGFRDFITKPILRDKLENVIQKIFN